MRILAISVLSTCLLTASAHSQDVLPPKDQLPPQSPVTELAVSTPKVNMVYLAPKDKPVNQKYVTAMNVAITSLVQWYARQMPNHRTFQTSDPSVIVVSLPHDASYYANNPRPAIFSQFWDNVLGDAMPLTGGRFNDPQNIWAYYIDADPICNECGGCGTSGVLVVSANDLRGLAGETDKFTDPCNPSAKPPAWGVNRWIGGLGHELGHAFGLPHPPGCDKGEAICDSGALMWSGFYSYPYTYLRADETAILRAGSFFFVPMDPKARAVKH